LTPSIDTIRASIWFESGVFLTQFSVAISGFRQYFPIHFIPYILQNSFRGASINV